MPGAERIFSFISPRVFAPALSLASFLTGIHARDTTDMLNSWCGEAFQKRVLLWRLKC